MSNWIVKDVDSGNKRPADSRSEAESIKSDMEGLGMECEILAPGEGENQGVEIVDHTPDGEARRATPESDSPPEATDGIDGQPDAVESVRETRGELPDEGPSVDEDPLVWMPDEFTDTIDGTVAINRKGMEVLAHHYDIQCVTELVTNPVDADQQVIVKAEATDADGDTYTAYGSASTERGDDVGLLVEMSDTRAYKRAVSRATGVGMVAVSELQNSLE